VHSGQRTAVTLNSIGHAFIPPTRATVSIVRHLWRERSHLGSLSKAGVGIRGRLGLIVPDKGYKPHMKPIHPIDSRALAWPASAIRPFTLPKLAEAADAGPDEFGARHEPQITPPIL